jgi:hypothetical protein
MEDDLRERDFYKNVARWVLFFVLALGSIRASGDLSNYCEVVRRVNLLYSTMEPQVKEMERLQRIEKVQKTMDECVREQQKAQKTIDVYAKELQRLTKEDERK